MLLLFCVGVIVRLLKFCHSFRDSFILVCIYLFVYVFISIFHEGIASVFAISCPVSIAVSVFFVCVNLNFVLYIS